MNQDNQSFAAFIGLDKSDKKINVSLQQCGKSRIESCPATLPPE